MLAKNQSHIFGNSEWGGWVFGKNKKKINKNSININIYVIFISFILFFLY
jgi:hypothetical protein